MWIANLQFTKGIKMDHSIFIHALANSKEAISASIIGITQEAAQWKPGEMKWSVLEIINHLWDEERLDFRHRLRTIFEGDTSDWAGIDPLSWVIEKRYNQRDIAESLAGWQAERDASLEWLNSLDNPDLNLKKTHPVFDPISAGDMLASWVAHDMLHLIQINKVKIDYYEKLAKPHSMGYAKP